MKFTQVLAGAGAMLASSVAMAGTLTGNVGVVSDYMFRGIDQSAGLGGAAVQGGVDYSFDLGVYTGLWVSNSSLANGNEADVYAGYGMKLGPVSLDGGAIYYAFTEDTEKTGVGYGQNADYAELYVGAGFGPAALKVFYTPQYGRDTVAGSLSANGSGDTGQNSLLYSTVSAVFNLNDTIALTPQLGYTTGDGAKDDPLMGDSYLDYSITATKKLKDDLAVSLAVVGTNLKAPAGAANNRDAPKFVIGLKKNFKI